MKKAETLSAIRREQALSRSAGRLKCGSYLAFIQKGVGDTPRKRDRGERPHWTSREHYVPAVYVSRLTGKS